MSSVARKSPTCSLLAHVHWPGLESGAGRGAEGRHHALRRAQGRGFQSVTIQCGSSQWQSVTRVSQCGSSGRIQDAGVSVRLLRPHLGKWSKGTLTLVGNLSYCFLAVGGQALWVPSWWGLLTSGQGVSHGRGGWCRGLRERVSPASRGQRAWWSPGHQMWVLT